MMVYVLSETSWESTTIHGIYRAPESAMQDAPRYGIVADGGEWSDYGNGNWGYHPNDDPEVATAHIEQFPLI